MINSPGRQRSLWVPLLLALNILVFIVWYTATPARQEFLVQNFVVSWDALVAGRWWTLLSAVFSHYLFLHLLLNMMVLKSFGQILEEMLGRRFFITFYLIAGIFSSLTHAVVSAFVLNRPAMGAVGASGALAGVLMLFCLMFPKQKILLFAIIPVPAIWGALAFIGLDLWGVVAQAQGGGFPIGHGAHLGGSFCGIICYWFIIRPRRNAAMMAASEGLL